MDADRFDSLLRSLAVMPSRRGIARAVAGLGLAGGLGSLLGLADAGAKKKKRKKKKKKKATCTDGRKNGSESDLDCGGSCPRCINGKACTGPEDCKSAFCVNSACGSCNGSNQCDTDGYGHCVCEPVEGGTSACNSIAPIVSQPATCAECADGLNCLPLSGSEVACVYPCGGA